jgi:hypothetical protein
MDSELPAKTASPSVRDAPMEAASSVIPDGSQPVPHQGHLGTGWEEKSAIAAATLRALDGGEGRLPVHAMESGAAGGASGGAGRSGRGGVVPDLLVSGLLFYPAAGQGGGGCEGFDPGVFLPVVGEPVAGLRRARTSAVPHMAAGGVGKARCGWQPLPGLSEDGAAGGSRPRCRSGS